MTAAAGYDAGSARPRTQLGLLSPASSLVAYVPLGPFTGHVLGLNVLEVLGLSTWGFGFRSVFSLLEGILV